MSKFNQRGVLSLSLLLIAVVGVLSFLFISSNAPLREGILSNLFLKPSSFAAGPGISNITDNRSTYPNSQVPKYEKYEISFDVSTAAKNLNVPYDIAPPVGVEAGEGITINGEFSQDNFATKLVVPAFYFQDFDYQVKSGQDWFYPKNSYWKIRFAPPQTGNWQYRITSQDSGGSSTSSTQSFTVTNSSSKGFIKVSSRDSRYFEYDDGTYFPGLGYNLNYDRIKWDNPVLNNSPLFQNMKQNGIQLIRHWISQWGIFSSNNNAWASMKYGPDFSGRQVPNLYRTPIPPYPGSDFVMQLEQYWEPCLSLGAHKQGPAIKPNTKYKVFVRYLIPQDLSAKVDPTKPQGLVGKVWDWLDVPQCGQSGQGQVVTNYGSTKSVQDSQGNWQWQILEGTIDTAQLPSQNLGTDFIRRFYLAIENVNNSSQPPAVNGMVDGNKILIDRVEIRENSSGNCAAASGSGTLNDLSNGSCGVNIVSKPSMDDLEYFDQKYSYAFDKTLELAHQNDVYLKLAVLEKNEYEMNHIDDSGKTILDQMPNCLQPDGRTACPSNDWFYGNWRNPTKVRWLQQAWWRYLQARWGYSTNIHSWELLNEGDPFNGKHYTQADEFAKYMHQFGNKHMVTTSFWNEFPIPFWSGSNYSNVDYADVHQYMFKGVNTNLRVDINSLEQTVNIFQSSDWFDSAAAVNKLSQVIGANRPYGVNKPVMRGETGFVTGDSDGWNNEILNDNSGVWLQKYIWAGINSGGLYESYWYGTEHIYPSASKDFRGKFLNFYNFIKDVPLSNGNYQEVGATASNTNLRVMGQKDLVNRRAHIWIDNKTNTWGNVINNVAPTAVSSATITIPNMPNGSYSVLWFNTTNSQTVKTETVSVTGGNLVLTLPQSLSTDIAVKIGDYIIGSSPAPSPSATVKTGDLNNDSKVNIIDFSILLSNWGLTGNNIADLNHDNKVGILDFSILLTNWG